MSVIKVDMSGMDGSEQAVWYKRIEPRAWNINRESSHRLSVTWYDEEPMEKAFPELSQRLTYVKVSTLTFLSSGS